MSAQLRRYYRQIRHLPSAPDMPFRAYETLYGEDPARLVAHQTIQGQLRPVDTSTPLATLQGLLESVNQAHRLLRLRR